jgi:hypothetical protein
MVLLNRLVEKVKMLLFEALVMDEVSKKIEFLLLL